MRPCISSSGADTSRSSRSRNSSSRSCARGWRDRLHLRDNDDLTAIMARYRTALPQLTGNLFLTDGGIETTLIFHDGLELPDFAAFDLLKSDRGRAALLTYFRAYGDVARRFGAGLI